MNIQTGQSTFQSSLIVRDGQLRMPLGEVRLEYPLSKRQLSDAYLAYHEGLDRHVELRVIKPEFFEQIGPDVHNKLTQACRVYSSVRHPNITAIYTVGTFSGHNYMLNEYVTGIPLPERVKERPLSESEALKIMVPIADGLAALWKQDFIHRGVSPLRVMINNEGTPKLDIVILPRMPLASVLIDAHAPFMAGYWPPEELQQSVEIDARSDMFSFGASLYYALIGHSPFGRGSKTELIVKTLTAAPKDPRETNPNLNPSLCEFIMRCLRTNPKERFSSTSEFMDALHGLRYSACCQPTQRASSFGPFTDDAETPTRATLQPGDRIGQCVLEKMVGAGAFGVVFKARHQLLDIPVAIKFLPREIAEKNPEYVQLFLREARTALRIRHKHVIGLYEAAQQNGQYYLMMEFAPNGSVHDKLAASPGQLPEADVIRIIEETALGLSAAMEQNIIHRDIKPANLMIGAMGEVKIADLGLAKRIVGQEKQNSSAASIQAEQLTLLSGEATIQGTPDYMAPEMAVTPDKVDIRADLYSLGATAYQLLTGHVMYEGKSPIEVLMKHVTQPIPAMHYLNPNVTPKLRSVIEKLLEKKPENRYQSPKELVAALAPLKI